MTVADQQPRSAGRIIVRNTIFGIGANLAVRGASVLFNILVIRVLGDTSFGQYSVVMAWAGIFAVLGDMGITQYMTREIARVPEKAKDLFWDVSALRFILAIVCAAATIGGAIFIMHYDSQIVLAITLHTTSYFLMAILAPLLSVIAGNERLDVISVFTVIGQVLFMVLGGIFLYAGFDFISLVVASLITLPIMLILTIFVIRREKMSPPPFKMSPSLWWGLLRAGLPFAFIQLALTSAYRFDTIILENSYSAQVVGWYNAAYNLTRALLVLTAAFSSAMGLTLAREHANNPDAIRPWYYRSVKFLVFLGLPLAIGGMILSGKIINFAYGSEYAVAALAFAILIWDTPLLMYTSLCGNLTTSINLEKRAAFIYAAEAGINIALNLLLIPQYGIIAASFVTVATELTGALLFYVLFRRELGSGLGFWHIMRLVLASVIMGVIVYALLGFHVIIIVGVGAVSYLVLVWLVRALTPEERGLLTDYAKRALRRVRG